MKRFIALLLFVLLVCFTTISLAEDFVIHAGIVFGDTKADVKAKETLIFDMEPGNGSLWYKGSVAGSDFATIQYFFDENNRVYDARYMLSEDNPHVLDDFDKYLNMLTEKYGEPLDKDNEICSLITGEWIKQIEYMLNRDRERGDGKTEYKIVSWSVPYDNYNVKIDLIYHSRNGYSACNIDYYTYKDEDIGKAKDDEIIRQQEQEKEKQEQMNDL